MDANEQEQEKTGVFPEEREGEALKKSEAGDSSKDLPIPASERLPKHTEKTLPAAEEKLPPAEREAHSAFDWQTNRKEVKDAKEPKAAKRESLRYIVILVALFLVALLLSAGALALGFGAQKTTDEPTEFPAEEESGAKTKEKIVFVRQYDDGSGLLSLPELYATRADAVVSVQTKGKSGSGVGSGFFVRSDGYIATVAHVLEGMEEVSVRTAEGKSYPATVVASNTMSDLALLKIDGESFPTLQFGASGELLTGERVIAIGTPISTDYAGSLCTGEVTYRMRSVKVYDESGRVLQKKMKLIQTNAELNHGNSGAPLFDEYGRVVGIVTMKLGNDTVGIGFAIPSDGASEILAAMMRGESLTEELISLVSTGAPKLGIVGEESTELGIAGVRIVRFSNSHCDAALKLREGDLILQIDGQPIASIGALEATVQEKAPGERVLVTVLRSEQRLTFEVILEKS